MCECILSSIYICIYTLMCEQQTLKQSGKELSPDQLSRIVSSQQTGNPLFLKIVLSVGSFDYLFYVLSFCIFLT